jgi:hypothetical protein
MGDNQATNMMDVILKKNGAYPDTMTWFGKTVPVPMTTNFDVFACAAFTFSTLRDFLLGKRLEIFCNASAHRNGASYSTAAEESRPGHENAGDYVEDLVDGQDGHVSLAGPPYFPNGSERGLDLLLALPAYSRVNGIGHDAVPRFCPDTLSYSSIQNATRVRYRLDAGEEFASGWLLTFVNHDTDGTVIKAEGYLAFLKEAFLYWDLMIADVNATNTYYTLPRHGVAGEFYGDMIRCKLFWQNIARIFYYITRDPGEHARIKSFTEHLLDAAGEYKEGVKVILHDAASAAGDAAATIANEAGKDLGKFGQSFFDNVGLWGLGFVALLIAYKVYV